MIRKLMAVSVLAALLLCCTSGCGDDKPAAAKAKDDGKALAPNPKKEAMTGTVKQD